jgi:coenzyme F420 hydrogenase subunit beta
VSVFGAAAPPGFDGLVRKAFLARAADDEVRRRGSSGGAVTALLAHMLRSGAVDGCLAVRMNPARPWRAEPFIARTWPELAGAAQSKYVVAPVNALLRTVRSTPGRYAAVMLPCQVHGFRKLAGEDPVVRDRICLVVGLFCATTLEPFVVDEMLRARGIRPDGVRDIRFREGAWPGRICAVLEDGRAVPLHKSNFKDGAINYLTYLYSPPRCRLCLDGSCEFADIAASDAWSRDAGGSYAAAGMTRILARTDSGAAAVESAISAGALVARDISGTPLMTTHPAHARKKGLTAPLRVARLARSGRRVPLYDRVAAAAGTRDRILERLESALMAASACRPFRYRAMKFLTSAAGFPIILVRQALKRRRYGGHGGHQVR